MTPRPRRNLVPKAGREDVLTDADIAEFFQTSEWMPKGDPDAFPAAPAQAEEPGPSAASEAVAVGDAAPECSGSHEEEMCCPMALCEPWARSLRS